MSGNVDEQVEIFFDLGASGGDAFTLDDATKGQLDDTTYVLGGDVATDVSEYVRSYTITRGRSRELDEIVPGYLELELVNYSGAFVPDGFRSAFLLDENGEQLLDEYGNPLYDETTTAAFGSVTLGKRVIVSSAGIVVFDGILSSWRLEYTADRRVVTRATAFDTLGRLGLMRFNAWTATSSQVAGERLDDILDRPEVDWGSSRELLRSDGTTPMGVSTLQGDSVTYGSNVLNYCQLVARSDLGRFFATRTGILKYVDRLNLVGLSSSATFSDSDPDAIGFQSAVLAYTDELLYSDVSVDREGGIAQTSTSATARAAYGIRRLDINGLLLDSDTQSEEMADFLLGVFSQPQARIPSIVVNLDGLSTTKQAQVASLDLADLVSVDWTPRGGEPLSLSFVVEGVSHSASVGSPHFVSLQLSPVQQSEVFVLDNTLLGVLDSGVLAF